MLDIITLLTDTAHGWPLIVVVCLIGLSCAGLAVLLASKVIPERRHAPILSFESQTWHGFPTDGEPYEAPGYIYDPHDLPQFNDRIIDIQTRKARR